MITTFRARIAAVFYLTAVIAISAIPRQACADQNLISLTCAQDPNSILQYNVWVDVANGLLTYQEIYNGQTFPSQTKSATVTSAEISTPGILIERTTGSATFSLNGTQEMSCHVSDLPLPQPQTKF